MLETFIRLPQAACNPLASSPLTSKGQDCSIAFWQGCPNTCRSAVKQEELDTGLWDLCFHVPQTLATQSPHLPKALVSPLTWVGHRCVVPPCGHFLFLQCTNWCVINKEHLTEINPEYALAGLMLKLKLQYFGHLIWRTNPRKRP